MLEFTRRTVDEALQQSTALFPVDAVHTDERIDSLREAITDAIVESGGALARRSRARRVHRVASRIRRSLELRQVAALLPASERELARELFFELANDIEERGADLVRAIEQFPAEELVSVDALLETLSDDAAADLSDAVAGFAAQGPDRGKRALHTRVAEYEADWSAQVSLALDRRIEKRRASALRLLADLEKRFTEAGNKALGLHLREDDEANRVEFGAREAATRTSGPVPTTGLEIVTGGLLAALPGSLRTRALHRRFASLANELLDRSRGRVRSAAVRYLLEWRLANVGLVRERLISARRLIEEAFDHASDAGDEAQLRDHLEQMRGDEQLLGAIVAAFS